MQVYGVAMVCAVVATASTLANLQGLGSLFGMSALLCVAVAVVLGQVGGSFIIYIVYFQNLKFMDNNRERL